MNPVQLAKTLLEKTQDGPVETWLTRMSEYVVKAGLNKSNINWGRPPSNVAHDIVDEARRTGYLPQLQNALEIG